RAGAGRVTALGHEAGDHPVEDHAVVEALAGQLLDPRHVLRRQVRTQLDGHRAGGELHDQGVLGIVHHFTSTGISTSQAVKSAPFAARTRAISALNQGPLGSITRTFGRSLSGKSASRRTRSMRSCGSATDSPVLIARTTSRPLITRPQ